jgi:hypothetical protein
LILAGRAKGSIGSRRNSWEEAVSGTRKMLRDEQSRGIRDSRRLFVRVGRDVGAKSGSDSDNSAETEKCFFAHSIASTFEYGQFGVHNYHLPGVKGIYIVFG